MFNDIVNSDTLTSTDLAPNTLSNIQLKKASLNYKEIKLLNEEADLKDSKIQDVVQNSFHSLTWELYRPDRGRFKFFSEVGTDSSRIHLLKNTGSKEKTTKLQRFIQFSRKHLIGSKILSSTTLSNDRVLIWELDNHGVLLKVIFRLFSGPGANIIVTDNDYVILDLLLRRPKRNEISGEKLVIKEKLTVGDKLAVGDKLDTSTSDNANKDKTYTIRDYDKTKYSSFNDFIEDTFTYTELSLLYNNLKEQANNKIQRQVSRLLNSIKNTEKRIQLSSNYEDIKNNADLLSSKLYLLKGGEKVISLKNWECDKDIVINLNPNLSPSENLNELYEHYHKSKNSFLNSQAELTKLNNDLSKYKEYASSVLSVTDDLNADIKRLQSFLNKNEETVHPAYSGPGLRIIRNTWIILVGRNATENDELLRHYAKGNDMWFHTRDYPGGYVIVKFKRDKTIPLDIMLCCGNLSVLFSKAKNSGSVDLYYTQVKNLRRAKNGKKGLVLPTHEKNLTIKPDKKLIDELLNSTPEA